jgi:hypothetical protein
MAILPLRLPDELYKALKEIAKEERTINTWIVNILKRYIEDYFKKKQGRQLKRPQLVRLR